MVFALPLKKDAFVQSSRRIYGGKDMHRNASRFPASRSGTTRNPLAEKWFGITGDGPVRLVRVPSATVFEFASQREPGPGVCG